VNATTFGAQVAPLKSPNKLYIGGEWVEPSASAEFEVICPATEELYVRVAAAQEADIDRAVAAGAYGL